MSLEIIATFLILAAVFIAIIYMVESKAPKVEVGTSRSRKKRAAGATSASSPGGLDAHGGFSCGEGIGGSEGC
jgi:hypothetical protein